MTPEQFGAAYERVIALHAMVKARRAEVNERRKWKNGWHVKQLDGKWKKEREPASAAPIHAPGGEMPAAMKKWDDVAHLQSQAEPLVRVEMMRMQDKAFNLLARNATAEELRAASKVIPWSAVLHEVVDSATLKVLADKLGRPMGNTESHTKVATELGAMLGDPEGWAEERDEARRQGREDAMRRSRTVPQPLVSFTPIDRKTLSQQMSAAMGHRHVPEVDELFDGMRRFIGMRNPDAVPDLEEMNARIMATRNHARAHKLMAQAERALRAAGHHEHADRLAAVRADVPK